MESSPAAASFMVAARPPPLISAAVRPPLANSSMAWLASLALKTVSAPIFSARSDSDFKPLPDWPVWIATFRIVWSNDAAAVMDLARPAAAAAPPTARPRFNHLPRVEVFPCSRSDLLARSLMVRPADRSRPRKVNRTERFSAIAVGLLSLFLLPFLGLIHHEQPVVVPHLELVRIDITDA